MFKIKKIISHRGNLNGPIEDLENTPKYINCALINNYDVEIDVWYFKKKYFLGHDKPLYKVDVNFLKNKKLWCHAKNIEALENMLLNKIHCFWHQNDKLTLTSKKIPWCYPNNFIKNGITVVLKKDITICKNKFIGICTDYPNYYKTLFKIK